MADEKDEVTEATEAPAEQAETAVEPKEGHSIGSARQQGNTQEMRRPRRRQKLLNERGSAGYVSFATGVHTYTICMLCLKLVVMCAPPYNNKSKKLVQIQSW